jgi:hypothetical protein
MACPMKKSHPVMKGRKEMVGNDEFIKLTAWLRSG